MAILASRGFDPSTIYAVDTVAERLEMAQTLGADTGGRKRRARPELRPGSNRRSRCRRRPGVRRAGAGAPRLHRHRARRRADQRHRRAQRSELELPLNTTFVKAIDLKFCGTANIIGRWDESVAMVSSGAVHPEAIISHRMGLDDGVLGYRLFERREALKVVLTP